MTTAVFCNKWRGSGNLGAGMAARQLVDQYPTDVENIFDIYVLTVRYQVY